MKTENFIQAISFVMSEPTIQKRIAELESRPEQFLLVETRVLTRDIKNQIHQVIFNFKENGDINNSFNEDIIAVIQGDAPINFRLIKYNSWHTNP